MPFKIKSVLGFLVIAAVLFGYRFLVDEMKKMSFNYEVIAEHEGQDRILESLGGQLSGSCTCSLRLTQQPDKPGKMPSLQPVYEGGFAMVSHLFFYQLTLIVLVWLCVMLQWVWPSDSAAECPTPLVPPPPRPKRKREPTPFAGLTTTRRAYARAPPPGRH